jgi:hypothetical protein
MRGRLFGRPFRVPRTLGGRRGRPSRSAYAGPHDSNDAESVATRIFRRLLESQFLQHLCTERDAVAVTCH